MWYPQTISTATLYWTRAHTHTHTQKCSSFADNAIPASKWNWQSGLNNRADQSATSCLPTRFAARAFSFCACVYGHRCSLSPYNGVIIRFRCSMIIIDAAKSLASWKASPEILNGFYFAHAKCLMIEAINSKMVQLYFTSILLRIMFLIKHDNIPHTTQQFSDFLTWMFL